MEADPKPGTPFDDTNQPGKDPSADSGETAIEDGGGIAYMPKIQEMQKIFDVKMDRSIRSQDLGLFLRSLGLNPTEKMLKSYVDRYDPKHEDRITFEDTQKIAIPLMGGTPPDVQLMQAFRVFDKDGRGKITTAELRYIITNLGDPLTPDEIEEFLEFADPEGNGEFDYNNLIKQLYPKN